MSSVPVSAISRAKSELGWSSLTGGAGYAIPGSRKKAMKGFAASANSPDNDTISKLRGMRAASRDLFMNSPLAVSILRRLKTDVINSGLSLQSTVDRDYLSLSDEQAVAFETAAEREFEMWANSLYCDFDSQLYFNEMQAVGFLNMLLSGDFFFMLPWRKDRDSFPYELKVKLIDADLVRDPSDTNINADVQGGVERDKTGKVVAYHVWNSYPYEEQGSSSRVPVYDSEGRQQIFHVFNPERLNARRGIALLAPVIESLKQLTRLAEAELMSALVSSFFTVFVKDMSGLGSVFGEAFTPEETITGGGRYGVNEAPSEDKNQADANDIELGHGNITYIDDQKDVTIADPRKTDDTFAAFWDSLSRQVSAAAGMPIESAQMHYQTSYTAAKAAVNDLWKEVRQYRALMERRFNNPVLQEFYTEASLRNRLSMPSFFDDLTYKRAWCGARWIGVGQGALNPLDEAKAAVVLKNNKMTTHEDQFTALTGDRYDLMVPRLAREFEMFDKLGLKDSSDEKDIVGSDGQKDPGER